MSAIHVLITVLINYYHAEELRKILAELNTLKRSEIEHCLKLVAQHGCSKLQNLMTTDPSKRELDACCKAFRNINTACLDENVMQRLLRDLPGSPQSKPSVLDFIQGYAVLQKLVKDELRKPGTKHVNIFDLLCSLKGEYSKFAVFALFAVWLPASNVDAERSFSNYSIVVSDRRRNLTQKNAEILTMVTFH